MIIRSNKDRWVTVDTYCIQDIKLSAKAKGILVYLLSLPDDWDLHITELVTHFAEGEKSIRAGMKELKNLGYVYAIPRKDSTNQKFIGNDYVIMENPREELRHTQNRDATDGSLLNTNSKPNTKKNIVDLAKYKLPIEVLNELTGRNFKLDNLTSLGNIRARVKDGSSLEEICDVIKFICKKRMETEFEMYLRPSTVFNKTKYENYLEEYKHFTKRAILNGTLKDLD